MSSIGRYEIEREIGRGAMGVVYLARDPRLHRQVAVKTYSLSDGISEEMAKLFRERFVREARAAASLSHPGIVTIYDAGEDETRGTPYIAMEYVQGESLKQRLAKGDRLDPAWVMAFGAVLADALHVAHRAGIVHRDIKPANILIREGDGAVKIADFGVARLKESDLTQSGAALGSPGYMSPEQVRGGALDGRSDLFSLAVVLYEALCGKRPFHGDDLVSLAYSIAHDTQVPLGKQLQACPPGLDKFFDRALAKDPGMRFPDGAAFRAGFQSVGAKLVADRSDQTMVDADTLVPPVAAVRAPVAATAAPVAGRRFFGLKLAAVGLLAAGVAAAAWLYLGRPSPLKAIPRTTKVSRVDPAAGNVPSRHPEEERQDEAAPQQMAAHQETHQDTQVAGHGSARTDVEPVTPLPRIPRNIQMTVPSGTEIHVSLDKGVGSSSSHAGDEFTGRITEPVIAGDRVAIPAGSRVHGRVSEAVPAKKGLSDKGGSLTLSFDRVLTPSGTNAPMSAGMTRVATGSAKKNAAAIGGGAAGGALLGKILGKGSKDAAVGTLIGGAIGTGIAAGTRGEDVELPAGTALTIQLDRPLAISVNP